MFCPSLKYFVIKKNIKLIHQTKWPVNLLSPAGVLSTLSTQIRNLFDPQHFLGQSCADEQSTNQNHLSLANQSPVAQQRHRRQFTMLGIYQKRRCILGLDFSTSLSNLVPTAHLNHWAILKVRFLFWKFIYKKIYDKLIDFSAKLD